ncbi:LuxR C-terminal-related transcriptional regulator [Luteococcus peritonei]|uniref:LuxR C-terminal-related transcriptional regulator n=1 Tax=Luteococcus peritonei TaxID=88874 RepID=A0ABW4RX01_9ACTN
MATTDHDGPAVPQRLVSELDRLVQARIAVICAPAGFGKRDLVRTWISSREDLHAHWLGSADELDAVLEGFGQSEAELLVLVAESGALLEDEAFVTRALDLAERNARVRVVFVGRSRPEAPLGSLAARGLLVDLDADQLAWTRQEMGEALAPRNPALPGSALDTVMSGTRGWPAIGRMLAAEPLTWAHTSKVARLADSYIDREVLHDLSPADRELLAQLSALPSLDPLSAAWITGRSDAAAQLSRLQAHGVPITWDDANTIRLNPMLRGYLSRRLAREDPELSQELSRRAALWLRNRGRSMEAIQLAMQVGLVDLAWMLAAEFLTAHMNRPELVQTLPRLVEQLPPGWELDLVRSLTRGLATPQTMISLMDTIDAEQMVARGDSGRLAYACFVLGTVRRVSYPDEVDVSRALEIAAESDGRSVHELDLALLSAVRTEYGLWLMHHARMAEAHEVLLSALGVARVSNVPWTTVTALGALAFINAEQGNVNAAHRLADEAILTGADTVFTTDALDECAMLALALTAVDTGDLPSARRWLDQLDRHDDHLPENDALRVYVESSLLLAEDDAQGAQRLVGAYRDQPRGPMVDLHVLGIGIAAFNAAIELGELDVAEAELRLLRTVELADVQAGLPYFEARLALARGDARTAYNALQVVFTGPGTTVENGKRTLFLLMIFGIAADEMHRADEALQAFQRAGVLAERMGLNLPTARHTRVAVSSRKEVPLTEAERNVLARLDSAKTLGDTADELFISVNTLKTHLRRIYKKLGVANREEAIERARMMGIRPSG